LSTTDPEMPMVILDCMAAMGIEFVVLHDETRVAAGETTSDVDLVTTRTPAEILSATGHCLHGRNIHPIVSWRYDVDSSSVFFANETATEGAQLDLVHGGTGLGNYGLRAATILAESDQGDRWQRASEIHELLYSIRKRHVKGQREALDELLALAGELPLRELVEGCEELFSPRASREMSLVLTGRDQNEGLVTRNRHTWPNARRLASRVRHSVGFWVALKGADSARMASEINRRFARLLPVSGHGTLSRPIRNSIRSFKDLVGVRWRAGVYITHGRVPRLAAPDLTLNTDGMSIDDTAASIVNEMQKRLMS
jgi:hypothetical protein